MASVKPPRRPSFRREDLVEIRGLDEIRATLDARGMLDGIPFMPEMERFAGRRARVWRRADRVCVEGSRTMRRLRDAVFLEGLRCDGAAHGGCQRACLILWKEAWLRRPEAVDGEAPRAVDPTPARRPPRSTEQFSCQSTELLSASTPLPAWLPGQYLRDLATGNLTIQELASSFAATLGYKLREMTEGSARRRRPARTPDESLGLLPGEWVEIKSLSEIEATLDARQRNRGLEFSPGMERYCGRRFRVARRVERVILEKTGEMRDLSGTVLLEELHCDGACSRGCPRSNPLYWREAWLKRAPRREADS